MSLLFTFKNLLSVEKYRYARIGQLNYLMDNFLKTELLN